MTQRMRSQFLTFAILAFGFSVAAVLVGFDVAYKSTIGERHREAGVFGLGATGGILGATDLGWMPLAVQIINDGSDNVQLGVRWKKPGVSALQTYTPDLPAGTSLPIGGAEVDSVWVNHAGASTSGDSLYWTAER